MADSWDMSFLVDEATQIQEARGSLSRHFGVLQQVLIGKHLVNFIGADDRLAFLRMMGRLQQRTWNTTVACRLRTPLSGEKRVALQARPGSGPMAWWLMMSESGADAVPLISEADGGEAMASAAEFGAVAAASSGDAPNGLDLSVFRAAVLADPMPGAKITQAKQTEIDQKLGATLRESASGGIVTQPALGEFALVHGRELPAEQIAERLTVTADAAGVSKQELGLSHDSHPLPADARAEDVREMIHNLRLDLAGRATGVQRSGRGYRASAEAGGRKRSFLSNLFGLANK